MPREFTGVIQDTASSATLCAILSAREKASEFKINQQGFHAQNYRIYCSEQTHSSIDKAVRIAGIGQENLVKIPTDENQALQPAMLEKAIADDIAAGRQPLCVVATLGTTGTTAVDPLPEIGEICAKNNIWLHIDAAFAGTALILPEYRWMGEGLETADSFVFNPHKWMFTNFDCSAYFVKDRDTLIRTFSILPEYLKTQTHGKVNDYRDWGIALGRRFRALKLWFVIREFGVEGIRTKIRQHIKMAHDLTGKIKIHPEFEVMAPTIFNALFFRFRPQGWTEGKLNALNEMLVQRLNASGALYLTHTKIAGKYIIRMVIGQTSVTEDHVQRAWAAIQKTAMAIAMDMEK